MSNHRDLVVEPEVQQERPLRFKVGVGLLVVYVAMWLAAALVPFLPLDLTTKSSIIAVDLIAAEVVGLVGIILIGKEAYQAIKARFLRFGRKGSKRKAATRTPITKAPATELQ